MAPVAKLTSTEIAHAKELLKDYPEALEGLELLEKHRGNPQTTVEDLAKSTRSATRSLVAERERRSIWQVLLDELYLELCGEDDSLREMVKEAKRNPDNSPLLTGLIVYLVQLANLPINPAIATVAALYILKIGISTFCEYTLQFRQTSGQPIEGTT